MLHILHCCPLFTGKDTGASKEKNLPEIIPHHPPRVQIETQNSGPFAFLSLNIRVMYLRLITGLLIINWVYGYNLLKLLVSKTQH